MCFNEIRQREQDELAPYMPSPETHLLIHTAYWERVCDFAGHLRFPQVIGSNKTNCWDRCVKKAKTFFAIDIPL